MANGGKRPGAGRKPRSVKFAGEIVRAENWIADRLPQLLKAQFDLAIGVQVKEAKGDKERVYTKAPDKDAGQYLINRVMGKPTERIEVENTFDLTNLTDEDLEDLERIQSKLAAEPTESGAD